MALPRGYAQYGNNKVMTASPAELTLMLYEGAIKFCNIAIDAIEKKNIAIIGIEQKDIEKSHKNIVKAENIIGYLRETLDMRYPVAQDFENIYVYLHERLVEANIKKDKEILEEVCGHLRSVRDTWKEVMRFGREKGTV